MRQLLRRLSYLLRHRRFEADLAEEMAFHRVMKQQELEEGGLGPREAAFASRRALGSVALAQNRSRDVWLPHWLQGLGQDFRLAVRTLAATRLVTTVVVLSLALGIGANTTIFSLVNSLLLRSLPIPEPERLVTITTPRGINLGFTPGWPYVVWQQVRDRQLFEGAVAWSPVRFNLAPGGETQFVNGLWVDGSFFRTLGVPAVLGRLFTDADDQRGGGADGAVAVISYGFWQRHFGGTANAIGHTLMLDHVPFTIVGITPPEFFGMEVGRLFDVAVPIGDEPLLHGPETFLEKGRAYWLSIMARLKATQTLGAAEALLRAVQPQIREATLPENLPAQALERYLTGTEGFALVPAKSGTSDLRRQYERALWTISAVVAVVLLVACANIANLLLARGSARQHELSVRCALGASRGRLVRQLFAESVVLAATGAAVGLLMASWGSRFLVHQLSTQTNPIVLDLRTDGRVLLFASGVAVLAALLFGIAPALYTSRAVPMDALKTHGAGRAGRARTRLASGLVVAQVALSLVLVVTAGLFARTWAALVTRELGFDRERVLLVNIDGQRARTDPVQRALVFERAREAVRALPGVANAAASIVTPLQGGGMVNQIEVSGWTPVPPTVLGGIANTWANVVSPDWFTTLGIPFVAGRDFTDRDRSGMPLVAIVNQALVRTFLNGANPLGRTITWIPTREASMEIVGVVADAAYGSPRERVPPTVYTPLAQFAILPRTDPLANVNLSVRSGGGSAVLLTKSVAGAIEGVDPLLALTFRPLADQVNASLTRERVVALLAGSFGALGLLLAGLGVYGVTAYAVSRRRTEIGIRMALGAAPVGVIRLVLSRVLLLVGIGVIVGTGVSLWASRFVATLLYGLEPRDPATLVGAIVVLATVGALAGSLPAWRASRIDPAQVLRES